MRITNSSKMIAGRALLLSSSSFIRASSSMVSRGHSTISHATMPQDSQRRLPVAMEVSGNINGLLCAESVDWVDGGSATRWQVAGQVSRHDNADGYSSIRDR